MNVTWIHSFYMISLYKDQNCFYYKYMKKGFTLIELLIVIAIIAILAVAVVIVTSPGERLADARDATRNNHINALKNSLYAHSVDKGSYPEEITEMYKEICNTDDVSPEECGDLVNLSDLEIQIPVDPQGGVEPNGAGYYVAKHEGKILIDAPRGCGFAYVDPRDGKSYSTTRIGDQCWMAKNLDHDTGCQDLAWESNNDKGWCGYYENTEGEYGLLYQWSEASVACPPGWELPADESWKRTEIYLGMNSSQAEESGWRDSGSVGHAIATFTGGNNRSGLGLEPGGRRLCNGDYHQLEQGSRHWTDDSVNGTAYHRHLWEGASPVYRNNYSTCHAMSVRCVRE